MSVYRFASFLIRASSKSEAVRRFAALATDPAMRGIATYRGAVEYLGQDYNALERFAFPGLDRTIEQDEAAKDARYIGEQRASRKRAQSQVATVFITL